MGTYKILEITSGNYMDVPLVDEVEEVTSTKFVPMSSKHPRILEILLKLLIDPIKGYQLRNFIVLKK